jgi:phosphohistidine phosphatase
MKTLLILRHAKSDWGNSRLADYDRPLNERGKGDAPRMGQLLRDEDIVPDLIITSSAERAQTTAELAAIASGYENEITYTRRLYHAAPDAYIELLHLGIAWGIDPAAAILSDKDRRAPRLRDWTSPFDFGETP